MATYVPPKRGAEFIAYVSLVSQADTKLMKANPTIAAGDFQVSKDGGALANLTTLPTVTPAAGKLVKITLSATEMTADNVAIVCSDAAGAEWCDLTLNLQTSARQIDDLAFPTVSGRSLDVTATGAAGVDWANVEAQATVVNLSATNIDADQVVASVSGAVGSVTAGVTLAASAVQAIWDALTAALTTVGSIGKLIVDNLNATVSSRATPAQVNAEVVDALAVDTYAESAAVPAATSTLAEKIRWLFTLSRNKITQTATTQTLRNDADTANVATAAVSDDGTTFTRGEWT